MASFNKVILMGNLTRDPERKQNPHSGQGVCRLGVATNRQYRNKQSGEMVQEVCFIDVDVWGAQADSCVQYLSKGRPVLVEGRLKYDTWQDQEGKARSKHSVVADRIVFLNASQGEQGVGMGEQAASEDSFEPRNDVERELMSQLDGLKNRKKEATFSAPSTQAKKTIQRNRTEERGATFDTADAELSQAFKDEPPFQDDLPF